MPPDRTTQSAEGTVVAAFPATGKTHYAKTRTDVLDSDSSLFSWSEPGVRHPDWPENYMAHITEAVAVGSTVLVSTHAEVRRALRESRIPFTLVYPAPGLRDEYRERMERRGSPPALIEKVIGELWFPALYECRSQDECEHIMLGPGQYLADVIA